VKTWKLVVLLLLGTVATTAFAAASNPTTLIFGPTADATLKAKEPTKNFGSNDKLELKQNGTDVKQFLIKFTVSGLGGARVTNAKLRLYNDNTSNKGGDFYRVADNSWTEKGVTWNNAPPADPTPIASLGAVSKNKTWYEVDITSLITGEDTYSLRVKSTSSDDAVYKSKEDSQHTPQLVLTTVFVPTADEVHWTITGQTSVTFDWRGPENTIFYGMSPGSYANQVVATTPDPLPTSSSGPFWEAKITGLQQNTLYYYRIGNGPEHTFRTPPPRGSADFTIYAEGDIGSTNAWSNVADVQQVIADGLPDFVLALGDLTYGDIHGADDVDQHFNDVMVWSQDVAYMPLWGNHEWNTDPTIPDHLNNYEGRFDLPNSQTSPGASAAIGDGPGEDWYWFDYGNTRFIIFPEPYSGAWVDPTSGWQTKAKALMDAAQADPQIAFIVTAGHRPAYSSNGSPSVTIMGILDALGDTHSKYVLNLVGHHHNYERSLPQHGVVHVTVGTGGETLHESGTSCLYATCPQPAWSAFRALHHGALRLQFTGTAILGDFICGPAGDTVSNINDVICNPGDVVDSFLIGAGSGGDTTPPTVSITQPAPTDTVSGTAPVSADASDNSTVVGVQFQLDGNNLGAEDLTPPYSISWDTTTVANGGHTLSAVARDVAGNTASNSIPVVVNNAPTQTTTVTFAPTADANIKADTPDTNYGSATRVGFDASPVEHALLKFTVSGLGGAQVTNAKLRLYNVDASSKGGDFYRVADNGWTETGVTWNNAPAADATPIASLGIVDIDTWYEVDLTSLITREGTYSLRVQTTSINKAAYYSKETSGFAPQLVLTTRQ